MYYVAHNEIENEDALSGVNHIDDHQMVKYQSLGPSPYIILDIMTWLALVNDISATYDGQCNSH